MKRLCIFLSILLSSFYLLGQRITQDSINNQLAELCITEHNQQEEKLLNLLAFVRKNESLLENEVDILLKLASNEISNANFIAALEWVKEAERVTERQGMDFLQGKVNLHMGEIYQKMGNWKASLETYQKGEKALILTKDSFLLGKLYDGYAIAAHRTGLKEQALSLHKKAMELITKHGNELALLTAQNNFAVYLLYENKPLEALPYFQKMKFTYLQMNHALPKAQAYGNLGYTYGLLKRYDQAFSYYDSCVAIAQKEGFKETLYITYLDMADTYAAKGDFKQAFQKHKAFQRLKESVNNKAVNEKIEELKVQYETEKNQRTLATQRNEIFQLKQQSIINRQRRLLSIIGFLIFATAALLLFLNYQKQRKKTLAKYDAQEQILQSEIRRKGFKEKQLKKQLANMSKDITDLSLDIVRKNEFSQELKKRLDELDSELPVPLQEKIKDLQIFTVSHLQINEDLATLQTNVEQINQDFYNNLNNLGKDLSQNEKQLCGLIRLNLSNKEVAVIRKISANSAKVARYRLRKKLNLNPEEDIVDFLQSI